MGAFKQIYDTVHIAARIRELKILPKEEIIDHIIEIQEVLKELMIYILDVK